MGNICDSLGITRKDGGQNDGTGGVEVASSSSSPRNGVDESETISPVPAQSSPKSKIDEVVALAVNTAEIKLAFAKKQSAEAAAAAAVEILAGPRIRLLPHQHSLFCERKQRVCQAVGQLQEMEVVKLEGFVLEPPPFSWIRIKPEHIEKFREDNEADVDLSLYYTEITVEEREPADGEREVGPMEYSLSREDVGHFMGARFEVHSHYHAHAEDASCGDAPIIESPQRPRYQYVTLELHGEVKPGPPRLTDFCVTGSMKVGTVAVAEVSYIGGYEGPTEYWWMRISPEGKRTQVTDPKRIPFTPLHPATTTSASTSTTATKVQHTGGDTSESAADTVTDESAASTSTAASSEHAARADSPVTRTAEEVEGPAPVENDAEEKKEEPAADPRHYMLTEDDLGCCLKAKCRPTRSDGVQGEIFTSSSSEEVVA